MLGLIIKGIGGFYYVKTETLTYQCRARGIFKKRGQTPMVGDLVKIQVLEDGDAVVNEILPRKNAFIRPPIANVDLLVVVVSATKPKPNLMIIDKFLVMAEKSGAEILLCINKSDLAKEKEMEALFSTYEGIYDVIKTSGKEKEGIEALQQRLKGKKSALTGPSGVGKSTLLNGLKPRAEAETGGVSEKTGRGKHTTRHVEIFQLDEESMVYDTPGFTSFDILEAEEHELQFLYPEMQAYLGGCKYDNCRHVKEPECMVRKAVSEGKINASRYASYQAQLEDIMNKKKY